MVKLLVILSLAALLAGSAQPFEFRGRWTVGKPYDVGQPIGLDQGQENRIRGLLIVITRDHIRVCGKEVRIRSVADERLTPTAFVARYNFTPQRLGFRDGSIDDVSINSRSSENACGHFPDPGAHLLVGADHAIAEVGNDYFALRRSQ